MREIEIAHAVATCVKCHSCSTIFADSCPMNVEFGIRAFSTPGIFSLADGIFRGYLKLSKELSTIPYTCLMCGSCSVRCSGSHLHYANNSPTELIENIRGMFVEAGEVHESINDVLRNFASYGNAWQHPNSKRVEWEESSEIAIPDFRKEKSEFLLFVGDTSLLQETQHIPQFVSKILSKGGVDFGTIKDEETDSGNEARELGESGLFEELAEQNISSFNKYSVKKIITISPHDYHTIRNDYPKLGMECEGIFHYTEIIHSLIKGEKIKLINEIRKMVTYQDPCHLGRYNNLYSTPREIINAIPGIEFVEMERTKENAFCCGSGGGRMWFDPDDTVETRINEKRINQAKEVEADIIATSCPYCFSGLQSSGNLGNVSVKDIAELVLEAMGG